MAKQNSKNVKKQTPNPNIRYGARCPDWSSDDAKKLAEPQPCISIDGKQLNQGTLKDKIQSLFTLDKEKTLPFQPDPSDLSPDAPRKKYERDEAVKNWKTSEGFSCTSKTQKPRSTPEPHAEDLKKIIGSNDFWADVTNDVDKDEVPLECLDVPQKQIIMNDPYEGYGEDTQPARPASKSSIYAGCKCCSGSKTVDGSSKSVKFDPRMTDPLTDSLSTLRVSLQKTIIQLAQKERYSDVIDFVIFTEKVISIIKTGNSLK